MTEKVTIELIDYNSEYYSLDDLRRQAQNWKRGKRKRNEIAMSHSIVVTRKTAPVRSALPGQRIADEVRIVASIA